MRVPHLAAILSFGVVTLCCTDGERSSADSAIGAAAPDGAVVASEVRSPTVTEIDFEARTLDFSDATAFVRRRAHVHA